ncbi:MAG: CPBP family intramembrane metalloprotease [Cyclobacteriaceae bacterium]|nr:CPBP family intramembrane metalloprotease [Cyclobacteriaceae bacterium]
MRHEKKLNYPSNAFGRFWMKVPMAVRAILTGFGVSSIGISIWALVVTNIPLAWSFVPMSAILILYWMYFSGKWNPKNTQVFRSNCMRHTTLKKPIWIWGLAGAFFLFILWHSGLVLIFRTVEFQPEIFKIFRSVNDSPSWTSWSLILMGSLVAGICEEIGYRGYMQKPLEQKFGPLVGISITSLVFVTVHLHQAWASGLVLVQLFVISFLIGYLAYATKSLLLGIIAHVALDIINFSYWWSDVIGTFERKPISMTGVDSHFIITVMVVLLSTVLFIIAIRKLLKMKDSADFIKRPNMSNSTIM